MNSFMYGFVFALFLLLNVFYGVYMFYMDNMLLGFCNSIVAGFMLISLFYKGFKNGK